MTGGGGGAVDAVGLSVVLQAGQGRGREGRCWLLNRFRHEKGSGRRAASTPIILIGFSPGPSSLSHRQTDSLRLSIIPFLSVWRALYIYCGTEFVLHAMRRGHLFTSADDAK